MRGTDDEQDLNIAKVGITPACAGNSGREHGAAATCEDHPRVCGEQQVRLTFFVKRVGSPPRVRGTASAVDLFCEARGITPACAGNSQRVKQLLIPH